MSSSDRKKIIQYSSLVFSGMLEEAFVKILVNKWFGQELISSRNLTFPNHEYVTRPDRESAEFDNCAAHSCPFSPFCGNKSLAVRFI